MTSLREALAAKERQTATYPIPVATAAATEAAAGALAAAEQAQRRLELAEAKPEKQSAAAAAVDEARAAYEACYFVLQLAALAPGDYEALKAAYPPADEDSDEDVDVDAFRPALIAACAVDSDLTAEEWAAELASDRWSQGERSQLYLTVLALNVRMPGGMAPKG